MSRQQHVFAIKYVFSSYCIGLMLLALAGCDSKQQTASYAPPIGHYEGTLQEKGRAGSRISLDVRHPSPGHYEAELLATPALSFVADTIFFNQNQLQLKRPGHPSEQLQLTLDGDFWRGTLSCDSVQTAVLLVKRGSPEPSTYRVEELPQATGGSAWLFAPADTGTPGPALALLPDSATAAAAPIWADVLAREGVIVLLLPPADTATLKPEMVRLRTSLHLLHTSPGADTATIGIWAAGTRAIATANALAQPTGPKAAFLIAQNALLTAESRSYFQQFSKLPVLGLYGGKVFSPAATSLRSALGSRRGSRVLLIRESNADLLANEGLRVHFGPGLPGAVVEWLRER